MIVSCSFPRRIRMAVFLLSCYCCLSVQGFLLINRVDQQKAVLFLSKGGINGEARLQQEEDNEALPFTLPLLSEEQRQLLANGERLQEQSKMGREGSGFVAMDVKAPARVVWECLLDFQAYPETIPTVRNVKLFSSSARCHYGTPSTTRAAFVLSKFRLNIAAIHNYRPHPEGDYMIFTLDPSCTNIVLKSAEGIWYTQSNPDGRGQEYTRVWLLCSLKVSRALPTFIVEYAAKRAMPRATTWLKPQVEAAAQLWLKNSAPATKSSTKSSSQPASTNNNNANKTRDLGVL